MNRISLIKLISFFLINLISAAIFAQDADQQTRSLIEELGLDEHDVAMRDVPGWRKPEKVYINFANYGNDSEQQIWYESALEVVGDVEIVKVGSNLDEETLNTMEVYIGRCRAAQIKHAKRLIWAQHSAHGVDDCMAPETVEMDFILTNAQHTSGPPIAEHVISLMMTMARGLNYLHHFQAKQEWARRSINFPIIEVKGKTMLIAGLGGIGTEVAERAHALGMRILATRNSSRSGPDFVEYVGLSDELFELAKQADVVVNTLPLTETTRNLFNKQFFDTVKKGAYYITVGRGETTVTDDLMDALKDGRLTAASLDVTAPEPLPPDHELWTLANAIVTPHVAANTDQGRLRRWLVVRENLRRYVNGDKLLNVVNKELGY